MYKKLAILGLTAAFLHGCASVPMDTDSNTHQAKKYSTPLPGNANLYIFRSGNIGQALKKDIWLNGECIGASANNVFFFEEIIAEGAEHKISTESEFSPNHLLFNAESGKSYFVEQYIKFGFFVGGANVRLVDEAKAKQKIAKLKLARQGSCSRPTL